MVKGGYDSLVAGFLAFGETGKLSGTEVDNRKDALDWLGIEE